MSLGLIRSLRLVLAVAALLMSLPVLHAGGLLLLDWRAVHSGQQVYVGSEYADYLWRGWELTSLGLGAAGLSAFIIFRREVKPGLLTLAFFLPFFGLLMIVFGAPKVPLQLANLQVTDAVVDVNRALYQWTGTHGHFPENHEQFRAALANLSPESPFKRGKASIPFTFVYAPGAKGPMLSEPMRYQPGTIVCAFSADLNAVWTTAVVMDKPVGGRSVFLNLLGQPDIHHIRLPERHPRTEQPIDNQ